MKISSLIAHGSPIKTSKYNHFFVLQHRKVVKKMKKKSIP
jgi:hypothetical protein